MGTMVYTDDQLIDRVASKAAGFTGWKKGCYLVAVRSNPEIPDAFDDKAYLFDCENDGERPEFLMVASCTTHPGVDVLKNYASNPKYNKNGAAVLKSDCIVYESHKYGLHTGYTAYRQAKIFPYFRDKDGDKFAEEKGPELTDQIILSNVHRANANKVSVLNKNWSAGCVVMNDPLKFKAFLTLMDKRPLSLCILKQF